MERIISTAAALILSCSLLYTEPAYAAAKFTFSANGNACFSIELPRHKDANGQSVPDRTCQEACAEKYPVCKEEDDAKRQQDPSHPRQKSCVVLENSTSHLCQCCVYDKMIQSAPN